jgi:uncharacterized membrane protein YhhN
LSALGFVVAAAYFVSFHQQWFVGCLVLKGIPVLLMLLWVQLHAKGRYARLVQVGLFFSFWGDVFLVFPGSSAFIAGLSSFLVAHLLYIAAFLTRTKRGVPLRFFGFLVWIVLLLGFLWGDLKAMKVPVILYSLTIAAMMWRSSALWKAEGVADTTAGVAIFGAVMFAISDSLIAINKFGFQGRLSGVSYAIMTLYWVGQLGLTLSTFEPSNQTEAEAA